MKGASLQEGNASLLCGILRLRIGMRYTKLILHIVEEYFPFKGIQYRGKEGCVCLKGRLQFLQRNAASLDNA